MSHRVCLLLTLLAPALVPAAAQAELIELKVLRREPFARGKAFGASRSLREDHRHCPLRR